MSNSLRYNVYYQHGQSTIEFIIACLVMIPLFFGIYYLVRYLDIKQSAIQASRYAAFERTWDHNQTIKTDLIFFTITLNECTKLKGKPWLPISLLILI